MSVKIDLLVLSCMFLLILLSLPKSYLGRFLDVHVAAYGETQPNTFQAKGTVTEIDISEMKSSLYRFANNQTFFELQDWNFESGKVLFTSGGFIGIMNANGTNVHVVRLPLQIYNDSDPEVYGFYSPVSRALFADSETIFALAKNTLLIYKINSSNSELVNTVQKELDGDFSSFDITSNPNNTRDFNLVLVESFHTLWLADSTGKKMSRLADTEPAAGIAVSPDGKKIAYLTRKNIESSSYYANVRLVVLDVESDKAYEVFHTSTYSTLSRIKWTANGELLTYQESAGIHIPLAYLYVTNIDGSFREVLYGGVDAPQGYVLGKDGKSILIGIDPSQGAAIASKIYRLDLSQPIPEFGSSMVSMFLIVMLSGMIAIRYSGSLKPRK